MVKDFYAYPYSESSYKAYARLYYGGTRYLQFVNVTVSLYKNSTLVGTKKTFIDYETYGDSGMWPNSENYLTYYLDKADFDSVTFNASYSYFGDSDPKFNKNALQITDVVITPFFSSTVKVAGKIKNLSSQPIQFPKIFICLYKDGGMILYGKCYADAPENILAALQTATFYTYMDMPQTYDTVAYLTNYSITLSGNIIISFASNDQKESLPDAFVLSQNYPNPFNASTIISFSLPKSGPAALCIYSATGQIVKTLLNGSAKAGYNYFTFDAAELPSGQYYYRLEYDGRAETRKMLLVK